jgi:hypothetical protein
MLDILHCTSARPLWANSGHRRCPLLAKKRRRLRDWGFASALAVTITRSWLWLADDSAAARTTRNRSAQEAAEMVSQSMPEN